MYNWCLQKLHSRLKKKCNLYQVTFRLCKGANFAFDTSDRLCFVVRKIEKCVVLVANNCVKMMHGQKDDLQIHHFVHQIAFALNTSQTADTLAKQVLKHNLGVILLKWKL